MSDQPISCRFPLDRYPTITLAHGGGGQLTQQLVDELFRPVFGSRRLDEQCDSAVLAAESGRLAFTTDSFVVRPLFFRGGDIGKLAVIGTCNDLAMSGAVPRSLAVGFILEEGFPIESLVRIAHSMAKAAAEIGVEIVAGDTKVVERGRGDGVYVSVSGIGWVADGVRLGPQEIQAGDALLVSGSIGRHGVALLADRQGIEFETPILSDCAHLYPRVEALLKARVHVSALRDLTRGGLATSLIELAQTRGLDFEIEERAIPVDAPVRGACEMLGLDPMYVANEGTMVVAARQDDETRVLEILREFDPQAALIGRVLPQPRSRVQLVTAFGSRYALAKQSGEQLPRIC